MRRFWRRRRDQRGSSRATAQATPETATPAVAPPENNLTQALKAVAMQSQPVPSVGDFTEAMRKMQEVMSGYSVTYAESMRKVLAALGEFQYRCAGCGQSMTQPAGLCRKCRETPEPLPVEVQADLIPGTKYAVLGTVGGKPCFRGTGYSIHPYYTETYAKCAKGKGHDAPNADCTCGFWVPARKESALTSWGTGRVKLEVEIGGTVLACAPDGEPTLGYRAQWQRVLSVTLPERCDVQHHPGSRGWGYGACSGSARYLLKMRNDGDLRTSCWAHAAYCQDYATVVPRPVTWLRENLQTEIRPGLVTDDGDTSNDVTAERFTVERELEAAFEELRNAIMSYRHLDLPYGGRVGDTFRCVQDGVTYDYQHNGSGWVPQRFSTFRYELALARARELGIGQGTGLPGA